MGLGDKCSPEMKPAILIDRHYDGIDESADHGR